MKNCILILCLFNSLVITGCKPKYVELTQKSFFELDASKVIEIDAAFENRHHTGDKWLKMGLIFPIKEPDKISTIINCIKKANFDPNARKILFVDIFAASDDKREYSSYIKPKGVYAETYSFSDPNIINIINKYITENNFAPMGMVGEVIPFNRMYFKTDKAIYFIGFLWDKKSVYGDWWDSPELLKTFREWGLKP